MNPRWVLPFAVVAAAALLFGSRWILVAQVYGLVTATAGVALLATGDAVPRLLAWPARIPAAYRLTGAFLIGWGGVFAFALQRPYRWLPMLITALSALVVLGCIVAMRRRPALSPLASAPSAREDERA